MNVHSWDKPCCSGLFQSKLILSFIFGFLQPIDISIFIIPNKNVKYLLQSDLLNSHVNANFPNKLCCSGLFQSKLILIFSYCHCLCQCFIYIIKIQYVIIPNRNVKYLLQSESLNSRVNVHFPNKLCCSGLFQSKLILIFFYLPCLTK